MSGLGLGVAHGGRWEGGRIMMLVCGRRLLLMNHGIRSVMLKQLIRKELRCYVNTKTD